MTLETTRRPVGNPWKFSERKAPNTQRDATITRLAVLKAAAAFGASRPELKSGDVLQIAERWLAWAEQRT